VLDWVGWELVIPIVISVVVPWLFSSSWSVEDEIRHRKIWCEAPFECICDETPDLFERMDKYKKEE